MCLLCLELHLPQRVGNMTSDPVLKYLVEIPPNSKRLADDWAGREIVIRDFNGHYITARNLEMDGKNSRVIGIETEHLHTMENACKFVIEKAPAEFNQQFLGAVTFRIVGSDKYLTNIMYGDQARRDLSEGLSSVPQLPADVIPLIVDYAALRPTSDSNFEGAGFNYSPMTAQNHGRPTKLQIFQLKTKLINSRFGASKPDKFGVKSVFGTYWRSQWWEGIISQSSHFLRDETWDFQTIDFDAKQTEEKARTDKRRSIFNERTRRSYLNNVYF